MKSMKRVPKLQPQQVSNMELKVEMELKESIFFLNPGVIGLGMMRAAAPEIIQRFIVDHGFFYMIVNSDGIIFFQGSQANF